MDLVVTGINFKTAPLEMRERHSYSRAAAQAALQRLRDAIPNHEWLLLSTCNRTELYTATSLGTVDSGRVLSVFLANGEAPGPDLEEHVYRKQGAEAIEHAMTVATSLDSLVVGETEILGQVKQAYNLAVEAGTTGKVLNSLLQQVLRVAKRVRSETGLSRGRVSVGSIAVDLVAKVFDDLSSKAVMIIGAGKIGEQTIRSLLARGVTESYVANRSINRGREIADRYGSIVVPYEKLDEMLPRADIIISSTSAPGCVLRAAPVRAAIKLRHNRPTLLIDLAVPRDIEDAVAQIDSVYLYNIDDLSQIANENLLKRRDAMACAVDIVRGEAAAVAVALEAKNQGIGDIMRQLDNTIAEIKEAELARGFAKDKVAPLGTTCNTCREEICNMLHRALSKMAAGPRKALHQAVRDGRWEELADFAAQLYGHDTSPTDKEPEDKV